jgi:hypothetical protein
LPRLGVVLVARPKVCEVARGQRAALAFKQNHPPQHQV